MATKLATPTVSKKPSLPAQGHPSPVGIEPNQSPITPDLTSPEQVRVGIDSVTNHANHKPEAAIVDLSTLDHLRITSQLGARSASERNGTDESNNNVDVVSASGSRIKKFTGSKNKSKNKSPIDTEELPGTNNQKSTGSVATLDKTNVLSKSDGRKDNQEGEEMSRDGDVILTSSLDNEDPSWRLLGDAETLRRTKCRRLFSRKGRGQDLALFYRQGRFFCMEAWCSHMGGPLYDGDLEDYKASVHVMCPWHAYMFDLETGLSDIGLKQAVYPVKVESGNVFVKYSTGLSLNPYLSL